MPPAQIIMTYRGLPDIAIPVIATHAKNKQSIFSVPQFLSDPLLPLSNRRHPRRLLNDSLFHPAQAHRVCLSAPYVSQQTHTAPASVTPTPETAQRSDIAKKLRQVHHPQRNHPLQRPEQSSRMLLICSRTWAWMLRMRLVSYSHSCTLL